MSPTLRLTIGTAGHVDHGKTSLVKALTGVDTDRWEEEKRRGMTIDLGFARWDLPSGRQAAIVDVPGHERFLRNMLAGVTGMDLVLLVVAADDGVMPQTREHLDIVNLLGVRQGLVVLTKTDLVDADLRALAEADVRQTLAGTFLADAPIVPVSVVTGEGLAELTTLVEHLTAETSPRPLTAPPRMAVDRVFTRSGFGTVVTGTMLAGRWQEGDRVMLWPGEQEVRIRGIQVHGETVIEALAGQRVALNLSGLDRQEISRGTVVGSPGTVRASTRLAAEVRLLAGPDLPLKPRDRVRVHAGTAEVMGRVRLCGTERIEPGDSGFVVIDLEQPLAVDFRDQFILRRFSPLVTMGGGVVLHPTVDRLRRHHPSTLARLQAYAAGEYALALSAAFELFPHPVARAVALKEVPADRPDVLDQLIDDGRVVDLAGIGLVSAERLKGWEMAVAATVSRFLGDHPWRLGMPREALMTDRHLSAALIDRLIERLERDGSLRRMGALIASTGHRPVWPAKQAPLWAQFTERLQQAGVLDVAGVRREWPALSGQLTDHLYDLAATGAIVALGADIVVTAVQWEALLTRLRQLPDGFTAAQARDGLGLSRRFVIPLLEYCDQHRLTFRQGDVRTMAPQVMTPSAGKSSAAGR